MAPTSAKSTSTSKPRFTLPGSEKPQFGVAAGAKPASGRLTVTVLVRPKTRLDPQTAGLVRLTRAQYAQQHGADPVAVKAVRAFAKEFGLAVEPGTPGPGRRGVRLSGSAAAMAKAFGVTLQLQTVDGAAYRVREGSIQLPEELNGLVDAVLGLDNRPQATPHFRIARTPAKASAKASSNGSAIVSAAANTSFTPVQIAGLYQFPKDASGAGQTIGIIELGGGFRTADLTAYFKSLG